MPKGGFDFEVRVCYLWLYWTMHVRVRVVRGKGIQYVGLLMYHEGTAVIGYFGVS